MRRGGLDEVGQDPEANPPEGEYREATEGLGGKRDAIVGANADGQALLLKGAQEDGPTLLDWCARKRATAEQEATIAVSDRQWITEGGECYLCPETDV